MHDGMHAWHRAQWLEHALNFCSVSFGHACLLSMFYHQSSVCIIEETTAIVLCYRDVQSAGHTRSLYIGAVMVAAILMLAAGGGGPDKMQPASPALAWPPLAVWEQMDACPSAATLFAQREKIPKNES